MPLDTRTPEQKDKDTANGIAYMQEWKKSPYEVPAHYECPDGLGLLVTHNSDSTGLSCEHIAPPRSDERGVVTPAIDQPHESRLLL